MDERFTSKMAVQTMIMGGVKKKDRQNKALDRCHKCNNHPAVISGITDRTKVKTKSETVIANR